MGLDLWRLDSEGVLVKAEYIAAYIQEQTGTEDDWQLQKLTYYADAWALAWTGRPLVSEGFEAWKFGPVCRELWNRRQEIKREGQSLSIGMNSPACKPILSMRFLTIMGSCLRAP